MMSHGMTLLAMSKIKDEMFAFALVALVAVHPIKAGNGDDDYIAVVMDATLCHMDLCAGAQERGLQFADGYAEDGDDVLVAFSTVEVARDQVIKERAEAAAKPTKRPRVKKSDAVTAVQEAGDETAVTGESSRPRRKSRSAGGGQGSRGKKPEGKLTLAAAMSRPTTSLQRRSLLMLRPCTSPWRTASGSASHTGKTPSCPKFPRVESTSPPTLSSIASSWRREKSKFNWRPRRLELSAESQSFTASQSRKLQSWEGG